MTGCSPLILARVALGLVACLLLFSPRQLHPRFFRTQFLTALGSLVIATLAGWPDVGPWPRGLLAAATILSLVGSLSWTLDPAPGGRSPIIFTAITLTATLAFLEPAIAQGLSLPASVFSGWAVVGASSALFLGAALTAMLVGHSY